MLEGQRLLVQGRRLAGPRVLPRRDVAEVGVVPFGLTLGGLALDAEVAAAGLTPVQGVGANQLGQLEKIGDAAGLLERLVQLLVGPEDANVLVELIAQLGDLRERPAQAQLRPRHAAVVPHQLAELSMKGVDRLLEVDLQKTASALTDLFFGLTERRVRGIDGSQAGL